MGGLIGISWHLVGCYLRVRYPAHWKDLGPPDLTTAQGPRRSRIGEWIQTDRYQRLHDAKLDKWVPILQKLPRRLGMVIAVFCLSAMIAVALAILVAGDH